MARQAGRQLDRYAGLNANKQDDPQVSRWAGRQAGWQAGSLTG